MPQTVLTVAMEVFPASLTRLKDCIDDLKRAIEVSAATPGDAYERLGLVAPNLHFASMMVFEDERYDPLLTIELNFDGDVGPFLPQLDSPMVQSHVRAMILCCKRPPGSAAALYDAVTAPGSKLPLAPFLEQLIIRPAVYHQGNRGLDRSRIARESVLFTDVQSALDEPALYRSPTATGLHVALRGMMVRKHPWLDSPERARVTAKDRLVDLGALLGFVFFVLLCLSAPGAVFALFVPFWTAVFVCLAAALAVAIPVFGLRPRRTSTPATASPPKRAARLPVIYPPTPEERLVAGAAIAVLLVAYVLLAALAFALPFAAWHLDDLAGFYRGAVGAAVVGLAGAVLSVVLVLGRLRALEGSDFVQDDPLDNPAKLAAIAATEDQIAQNHMGSLVHVKPGLLRAVLLRLGLTGLGLLLRVTATDGYLASMRTIHFAHWALIGNGGRLLFFSNFDSSWESYLDDFIEKAHAGLTLAWTNGVGFPRTRFLVQDGATNGRLFKAWARHSMSQNLFWFSAYPTLSVNQVERQYRVADGLRKTALTDEEARIWARDL